MKKIFITIPWFFPAYKAGGPIQSIVNMIKHLDSGYEFFLFTSHMDLNKEKLRGIKINQWVQYNPYTKVWYAGENISNAILQQVELVKPDVLYIVGLFDWHFNIVPLFFCSAPKKIISVRGMMHPGALSQKKLKKMAFLSIFKFLHRRPGVIFHATDEVEQSHIRKNMGEGRDIKIAANFPNIITRKGVHSKKKDGLQLLTIALISPMKNHLLVLKALANCTMNISYNIYGPVKDSNYWQQCQEQIAAMPANISVKYFGDSQPVLVPEKLHEADVFIMPSKSENFGHSIIEALSAGLPVITSLDTPWNGLKEKRAGINVTPSIEALTEAINFFAEMNSETYEGWSTGAAAYAQTTIDLPQLAQLYSHMFDYDPAR